MSSASATKLPAGTLVRELEAHGDERGVFTELYRLEWGTGVTPVQWNAVRSEAGVLRGVHVHVRHDDYLMLAPLFLRQARRLPTGEANVVLGQGAAVGGFPHALAPIAEETTFGYINEYLCA